MLERYIYIFFCKWKMQTFIIHHSEGFDLMQLDRLSYLYHYRSSNYPILSISKIRLIIFLNIVEL